MKLDRNFWSFCGGFVFIISLCFWFFFISLFFSWILVVCVLWLTLQRSAEYTISCDHLSHSLQFPERIEFEVANRDRLKAVKFFVYNMLYIYISLVNNLIDFLSYISIIELNLL